MKRSLLIIGVAFSSIFICQSVLASENVDGTLTLQGDKIVFETPLRSFIYSLVHIGSDIPGAKVIKFDKKSLERNGKEIDISEVTLENQSDGSKFTLIESIPTKFVRVTHEKETTWTPSKK